MRIRILFIVGTLTIVLLVGNQMASRYCDSVEHGVIELDKTISTLNRLKIDTKKMEQTIADYNRIVPTYNSERDIQAAILRRYDEIAEQLRPMTLEFAPIVKNGNIIGLPLTIKGKLPRLESLRSLISYLESCNYPFVKVSSVKVKFEQRALSSLISGDIILFELGGG